MRVVVAEDLFLLREGLVRLLKARGFEIVAATDSAPGLLDALLEFRPDLAIVDIRLPPTHTDDGLRAALTARERIPGLPILLLSQYVEQIYAQELLADQAGGVGYLLKDRVFSDDQFVDVIRTVAAGGTVMDPEVVTKLLDRRSRGEREPSPGLPSGNARCWSSWPRDAPTAPSRTGSSSARRPCPSTAPASSPSWSSLLPTTTTAACWPFSPTSCPCRVKAAFRRATERIEIRPLAGRVAGSTAGRGPVLFRNPWRVRDNHTVHEPRRNDAPSHGRSRAGSRRRRADRCRTPGVGGFDRLGPVQVTLPVPTVLRPAAERAHPEVQVSRPGAPST